MPLASGAFRIVLDAPPPRVEPPLRLTGRARRRRRRGRRRRELASRLERDAPPAAHRPPRDHRRARGHARAHGAQGEAHRAAVRVLTTVTFCRLFGRNVASRGNEAYDMTGIPAIDAWCNPFDERGIRTIFIDNEEVYFMMGEQWGRTENMQFFTARGVGREAWTRRASQPSACPSLKMAFYRRARWPSDIEHEHVAKLVERAPGPRVRPRRHRPDVRDEGRQAPRAGGHRVRLRRCARPPVRLRHPDQRARVVALLHEVRRARRPGRLPGRALGGVHAERVRQADPARRHRDLVPRAEARRRPHRLAVGRGADRDGVEAPERLHRDARGTRRSTGTRSSSASSTRATAASGR